MPRDFHHNMKLLNRMLISSSARRCGFDLSAGAFSQKSCSIMGRWLACVCYFNARAPCLVIALTIPYSRDKSCNIDPRQGVSGWWPFYICGALTMNHPPHRTGCDQRERDREHDAAKANADSRSPLLSSLEELRHATIIRSAIKKLHQGGKRNNWRSACATKPTTWLQTGAINLFQALQ